MKIDKFEGEYKFLSNFYPCTVFLDGEDYPSVEHAYQAAKTLDTGKREPFRSRPFLSTLAMTAAQAKKAGRALKLRDNWDKIKLGIMLDLLRQKFEYPHLKDLLLNTGDAQLVEGNWWGDTYWGVCNGRGNNYLGELLMQIRKELRG